MFLVFTVVLLSVLALTGCGKKEATPTATAPAPAAAVAAAPAEPAIDKDAVLTAAAKEYFAQIATNNNIMSATDLKDMLDDNPQAVMILDIRAAADFEAGHIDGAVHSNWADLGDVLTKIPTNRQVVVACYSGQTAGQAIAALRLAGFSNVKSLAGGMGGWSGAGLDVTATGANPLASKNDVSKPRNAEQEVLWEAAKANFASVGKDGNKIISSQDLYDALETNPRAFNVIDIRGKSDWDAGHIVGSTHVAWAQMGNALDTLPKNGRIVIACFSGQTAGQTVGVLRTLGYDAYSLAGGMNNGWGPSGLPLEK